MDVRSIRNIGILAHIDAGKTSLTERILYVSGRIRRPGSIDEGTATTDYLDVERERGITVKAAAAHLEWHTSAPTESSVRINLIDTPGHVDFASEVDRSLRALDGAVVLLCAVAGVQSRTETLFRACSRRGAAHLAFVNKMDRRGASFKRTFDDIVRVLDPRAVAIHLPWGEAESFHGLVDLVSMRAFDFSVEPEAATDSASGRSRPLPQPVPPELVKPALEARASLIEALASDDAVRESSDSPAAVLLDDFVSGRESDCDTVKAALREAVLAGRVTPVLCGSAFSDASACLLLDAVADYLPSPPEARIPEARIPGSEEAVDLSIAGPFSALVFKTAQDTSLGRLSWSRIWSGSASVGDKILDVKLDRTQRLSSIFRIQADKLESIPKTEAGDIVALSFGNSPSAGSIGATLCDPRHPLLYEPISFEEPVVSLALEPKTRQDAERLRSSVARLIEEDPSLRIREDPLTGRVEISGMGELHLEVAVDRLVREYGARVKAGPCRVSYREALKTEGRGREDFDRDLGGERARASIALRVRPGSSSSAPKLSFALQGKVPAPLVEAVRRGVDAALSVGPSAGYPLDAVEVVVDELVLPGGLASALKIGERAVEIAASIAAGKAASAAGSNVIEPVMRLELRVPEDFLGRAAAAISSRGGRIESIDEAPGGGKAIVGAAPLRCLFGFATELRSATEGRADYTARFFRYEPVPSTVSVL